MSTMDKDPEVAIHKERSESAESTISASSLTKAEEVPVKSKQEKRLVLKQDFSLLLLLSGCFWFAYLDRGAIGNARIMGYQTDMKFTSDQFFNCLMMFYIGYMLFELPAALSLRLFPPNFLYGGAVISFGLFAVMMSVARSYGGVIALRLLLGFAEAYVQTGNVFISLWYKREELTTRYAFFFISAPIAGATSGLIAYGVDRNLNQHLGKSSWEWFFIIEGVLTIGWGILVIIFLPRLPETVAAKGSLLFRSQEERDLILERTRAARNTPNEKIKWNQVWWALKDIKTWTGACVVAAPSLDIAAFGAFLPTFMSQFGFSRLDTQLYSIIPYAIATITLPIVAIASDRLKMRAIPIFLGLGVSVIGFILLLACTQKIALVVGCCFVAAGCYPTLIVACSWVLGNNAGFTKRCTAWAVCQIFIQGWSIVSTQIYTQPPRFFKGHGILLGLHALAAACAVLNYILMKRENKKRDNRAADFAARGVTDPEAEKTYEELCDYHPSFRYQL